LEAGTFRVNDVGIGTAGKSGGFSEDSGLFNGTTEKVRCLFKNPQSLSADAMGSGMFLKWVTNHVTISPEPCGVLRLLTMERNLLTGDGEYELSNIEHYSCLASFAALAVIRAYYDS
jgi:hypothetical protein